MNFYRKAIALRKRLPVVRHGTYKEHFPMDGKRYVYSRETEEEKLLVICSFSEQPVALRLPGAFPVHGAELLLCNYESAGDTLQPYECRVYYWKK